MAAENIFFLKRRLPPLWQVEDFYPDVIGDEGKRRAMGLLFFVLGLTLA